MISAFSPTSIFDVSIESVSIIPVPVSGSTGSVVGIPQRIIRVESDEQRNILPSICRWRTCEAETSNGICFHSGISPDGWINLLRRMKRRTSMIRQTFCTCDDRLEPNARLIRPYARLLNSRYSVIDYWGRDRRVLQNDDMFPMSSHLQSLMMQLMVSECCGGLRYGDLYTFQQSADSLFTAFDEHPLKSSAGRQFTYFGNTQFADLL